MAHYILPIVSVSMAESLRKLKFSEPTPYYYYKGALTDKLEHPLSDKEECVPAPSLQEVQAWMGRRKRMDVLVYREVFFNGVGKFYAVIIRRKDGMIRETAKCPTYNQALEMGLKVAINLLGKKRKGQMKG